MNAHFVGRAGPVMAACGRVLKSLANDCTICCTLSDAGSWRAESFSNFVGFGRCVMKEWERNPRHRDFWPKFARGCGVKNRRLHSRKSPITQVLISRTLSVCGEVAERLKAAVC